MAHESHTDDSTDCYQQLVGPEGSERLVISDTENWLESDDLIASETYVCLNDWR